MGLTSGNDIRGNYVGIDRFGTSAVPNTDGIRVINSGVFIESNVISGNSDDGIDISAGPFSGSSFIQRNVIGLDFTGTAGALGNAGHGIHLTDASNVFVGAPGPDRENVVSGNAGSGISISGSSSSNNVIVNNRIGTDATGTLDRGNGLHGIEIADGAQTTTIGIDERTSIYDAFEGNLISGNDGSGILISSAGFVTIAGNRIGAGNSGIAALPNLGDGVTIEASNNITIGGFGGYDANQIAHNLGNGVAAVADPLLAAPSTNVLVRANEIVNNGGLGIDLSVASVSLNDPGETDGLQNFPLLDAVLSAGSTTTVSGSITSTPNTTLELDFYASDAPDATNFGEGQRYLGTLAVITDGAGGATFNQVLSAATVGGEFVTATATGPTLGTSEFSLFLQATTNAPPTIVQDSLLVTVIDPDFDEATWGLPTLIVNEGYELSLTGDFADVDSSPQVTIYWGDGTITTDPQIRAESFSARKVYADDDPSQSESNVYPVIVRVTDTDGSGSAAIGITVRNVRPVVDAFDFDSRLVNEGQTVTLLGTFTDPGSGDYHFVEIDWGDGSGNQTVAVPRGDRSFAATYQYADDGVYDVGFSLFDDDRDPLLPDPGDLGFAYDFHDRIAVANVAPECDDQRRRERRRGPDHFRFGDTR